jgi:hypothetical protein
LVSNDYFDKNLPKVTYLVARFVRLTQITIALPQANSGYIDTKLNYRYYFTPNSVTDNRVFVGADGHEYRLGLEAIDTSIPQTGPNGETLAPKVTQQLVFTLPIDTYVNDTKLYAWAGHYYDIVDRNTPDPEFGTHYDAINHPYVFAETDRMTNTVGDRYNTKSINYIEYNNRYYYLDENNKLFNSVAYSSFLNKVVYYNKTTSGQVSILVGGTPQSVPAASLNFATEIVFANVKIEDSKLKIKQGVYKTFVIIEGKRYGAISNFGAQPTVNGESVMKIYAIDKLLIYNGDYANIFNNVMITYSEFDFERDKEYDLLLNPSLI